MNTDKIYAEAIANENAPKKTSKTLALKKLDAKAKRPSEIFAYTFGVVSSLILGVGMCLSMSVIGGEMLLSRTIGIIVGVIGIAGVSINYPIYKKIRENGKKKYAQDIINLAKVISDEE